NSGISSPLYIQGLVTCGRPHTRMHGYSRKRWSFQRELDDGGRLWTALGGEEVRFNTLSYPFTTFRKHTFCPYRISHTVNLNLSWPFAILHIKPRLIRGY